MVKTFGSRMNYVREVKIYEKLKGSGLAPDITSNWDGAIEHEYIEGRSFEEVLKESRSDTLSFIEYANIFFDWYLSFRDRVKLSLGDMDFNDFVIVEKHLYCIDFEHCKPGNIEDDIAYLTAHICLSDGAYTLQGMENSKVFVKAAWDKLDMSSDRLYDALKSALDKLCEELGIAPVQSANEYLATFVCTGFMHTPDSADAVSALLDAIRLSGHKWTLFADHVTGDAEKYIRYIMSANKEGTDAVFLTDGGSIIEFPLLLRTGRAVQLLEHSSSSEMSLKDALMLKFRSRGMAVERMKQD